MQSIITSLFLTLAVITTYGIVNYYYRKELKKCKVYYLPRKE